MALITWAMFFRKAQKITRGLVVSAMESKALILLLSRSISSPSSLVTKPEQICCNLIMVVNGKVLLTVLDSSNTVSALFFRSS